jgi:hypothetical protein
MHGARSLVRLAAGRAGRFWTWIDGLAGHAIVEETPSQLVERIAPRL